MITMMKDWTLLFVFLLSTVPVAPTASLLELLPACSVTEVSRVSSLKSAEQNTTEYSLLRSSGEIRTLAATTSDFAIRLPSALNQHLVDYFDERNVIDGFKDIFHERDSSIPIGTNQKAEVVLKGNHRWWIERPTATLHEMAPANAMAFKEFLTILKKGEMDGILERLANHLGWSSLTIYNVSFYGFWGNMQTRDITSSLPSRGKAFEMHIPISLPANGVQLRVHSDNEETVVFHQYEMGVASVIRDGYTQSVVDGDKDMMLAVSLVVGEHVNSNRMESTMHDFTQTTHPDKDDYLISTTHWSRSNTSVALPTPVKTAGDFVFVEDIKPGQIEPIQWAGSPDELVTDFAFQVGLPDELTSTLLQYCQDMGVTKAFQDLVINGDPLEPGGEMNIALKDQNWYIQRPDKRWNSNMHWISPLDKESHDDYLKVLSKGGFDEVLQAIGNRFYLEGLVAYQITFIGVSHCVKGYNHRDFNDSGGRGFNVIIPLILADDGDATPELDLLLSKDQRGRLGGSYKYQYGIASMVGDDAIHATAAVDYRPSKQMRMAATIYVADIQESNIDTIMMGYTQKYPAKGSNDSLLNLAGAHWKQGDANVRLPTYD